MLKTTKTIMLNGEIADDSGNLIAHMSAHIDTNGRMSVNRDIMDKTRYETEKDAVQEDIAAFEAMVDAMVEEG